MFSLSKASKLAAQKTVKKMLKNDAETMSLDGFEEMYVSRNKNQPRGTVFIEQIKEEGKTFYVCQKVI
jgi:predicted peroxiredoxin